MPTVLWYVAVTVDCPILRSPLEMRCGFLMNFVLTEFKSITRVLAMVVQVKRRIYVTDEEVERSEDEEVNKVVASVQVPMYWMHASTWTCYMHEEGN